MPTISLEIDDEAPLTRTLWAELTYLRARWACELCGEQPYGECRGARPKGREINIKLHAHHANGDDTDHRLANAQCLCATCHARVTMTGRKRKMSDRWYAKMRANGAAQRGKPKPLGPAHRAAAAAWMASPEFQRTTARGRHTRWHVRRGIVNPECALCIEEAAVDA